MLLVGIDWADAEHVYCLMDDIGSILETGTIPHSAEGLARLATTIRTHAKEPDEIYVALETAHGPLAGTSIATGSAFASPAQSRTCAMPGVCETIWQFAFSSLTQCTWANAY